jgi:ABC-2 type transport system permease protein
MSLWAVVRREWLRSTRSGLWYLGAALCYIIHAAYFDLILSTMVGAQPQPVSPLRWLLGGDLLLLLTLLLPVMLVKAFAEERQNATYDQLLCSGLSPWTLVWGKMLALGLQWTAWVLCLTPMLVVMHVWGNVAWAPLGIALLGFWCVGLHWCALGLALSCRSETIIGAYAKSAVGLMIYWALPFLKLVWRDPFYRVVMDTFDFRAILERSAQGLVLSTDVVFLLGGIPLWCGLAVWRLDSERYSLAKYLKKIIVPISFGGLSVLIFYTALFIAHHRPRQWDVSPRADGQLSKEYTDLVQKFPDDLQITAVLPRQLTIDTYAVTRDLILSFLQRTSTLKGGLPVVVLDPDVDGLEMERLQQQGVSSKNKIGFVHLRRGDRQVILSYDQWVSLGVMTQDNEPHRFVRQFHGEALMARAVNTLTRDRRGVKVLLLAGQRELDLANGERLGGSLFLELFQQLGMQVEARRPGVENIELKDYSLVLSLDPMDAPPQPYIDIIYGCRKQQIPLLALSSGLGDPTPLTQEWEAYGVQVEKKIIYQRKYPTGFDAYTFPVHELANHELMEPLKGQLLIFDRCRPLLEGVPSDPRLVVKPLMRVEENPQIWGESSAQLSNSSVNHTFDATDSPSPLVCGMAVHSLNASGKQPLFVLLGARTPFENRFFLEAGNRNFVYQCIEWLTGSEAKVLLPPRPPQDYRFRLDLNLLRPLQWGLLGGLPFILIVLWWRRCRRWH